MRKKFLLAIGAAALMLSSCTVSQKYEVTGNPIGSKEGKAVSVMGFGDCSYSAAAKKGKITKIGATQETIKFVILPVSITKVYGE